MLVAKVEEGLHRPERLGRVEREAGRLLFVVDELAPHRPQEGRQADDRRLDADAVLVDVPSPSSSRVSLIAFWTMSFHVHPDLGSATPARRKRSRL